MAGQMVLEKGLGRFTKAEGESDPRIDNLRLPPLTERAVEGVKAGIQGLMSQHVMGKALQTFDSLAADVNRVPAGYVRADKGLQDEIAKFDEQYPDEGSYDVPRDPASPDQRHSVHRRGSALVIIVSNKVNGQEVAERTIIRRNPFTGECYVRRDRYDAKQDQFVPMEPNEQQDAATATGVTAIRFKGYYNDTGRYPLTRRSE